MRCVWIRATALWSVVALGTFLNAGCGDEEKSPPVGPGPPKLPELTPERPIAVALKITVRHAGGKGLRFVVQGEEGPVVGVLQRGPKTLRWTVDPAQPVDLPHRLPTLAARNGRALLQFGDRRSVQHPSKVDLYFIDARGRERGKVVSRYGARSEIEMSEDGYVAVAGTLLSETDRTEIGLYSPTGDPLFQTMLPEGRRANIAVPGSAGQRVAVVAIDEVNPLSGHRLEILDSGGKRVAARSELGILQKVVSVAGGALFFVQARDRIGLVDARDGSLRWSQSGEVRLISPYGAATDPAGKTLFLVAGEWDGTPRARYGWRLELRDVATGDELARFVLPGEYPSSRMRVIVGVTDKVIELLAGEERIMLAWRRP